MYSFQFSCSAVSNSLRPHGLQHARPPCPSLTPGVLLKLMSIESVMPSNNLILCHPRFLPWIFPSIRVFSNESALLIRWPMYWSFSFSISPSSVQEISPEHPGLISFRMDWLDLLAVQGTLKSLLQHHRSVLGSQKNWAEVTERVSIYLLYCIPQYLSTSYTSMACLLYWRTYTDILLSPKVHSLYQGLLLMLYIQRVSTSVQHISIIVLYRIVPLLKKSSFVCHWFLLPSLVTTLISLPFP